MSLAKPSFQMLFGHGVAAVFDDEDAACEASDVGQDFGQYGGLGFGCYGVVRYVHVLAFFCRVVNAAFAGQSPSENVFRRPV